MDRESRLRTAYVVLDGLAAAEPRDEATLKRAQEIVSRHLVAEQEAEDD